MAAPTTWSTPASGGTTGGLANDARLSYTGGYWFALSRQSTSTLVLRYATDPSGTWSTATLPANPASTTSARPTVDKGVLYDGTHYAFAARFVAAGITTTRIYYATDPAGTWTSYDPDGTDTYLVGTLFHDGSRWIMGGNISGASAFIGYTAAGSAVSSTWTFGTTALYSTTGYYIQGIGYDGTNYVTAAGAIGGSAHLRWTDDITGAGTFGTPTTSPLPSRYMLDYTGSHWVTVGGSPPAYYSTTGTATWSAISTALSGLTTENFGIDQGVGYWLIAGNSTSGAKIGYARSSTPDTTYTTLGTADLPFTGGYNVWDIAYGNGHAVAVTDVDTQIGWASMSAVVATLLRQRQSPTRTPSRVRGVDLRQRQTPFIT